MASAQEPEKVLSELRAGEELPPSGPRRGSFPQKAAASKLCLGVGKQLVVAGAGFQGPGNQGGVEMDGAMCRKEAQSLGKMT